MSESLRVSLDSKQLVGSVPPEAPGRNAFPIQNDSPNVSSTIPLSQVSLMCKSLCKPKYHWLQMGDLGKPRALLYNLPSRYNKKAQI